MVRNGNICKIGEGGLLEKRNQDHVRKWQQEQDANRPDIFLWKTFSFFEKKDALIFFYEGLFPFYNRPKINANVKRGGRKNHTFKKDACPKLSARMKIKNGNFSRRVAFLKKPLCQQFLAFKCSKLSQNLPPPLSQKLHVGSVML